MEITELSVSFEQIKLAAYIFKFNKEQSVETKKEIKKLRDTYRMVELRSYLLVTTDSSG